MIKIMYHTLAKIYQMPVIFYAKNYQFSALHTNQGEKIFVCNKSLTIKIYFILIFGKETNKCLAY